MHNLLWHMHDNYVAYLWCQRQPVRYSLKWPSPRAWRCRVHRVQSALVWRTDWLAPVCRWSHCPRWGSGQCRGTPEMLGMCLAEPQGSQSGSQASSIVIVLNLDLWHFPIIKFNFVHNKANCMVPNHLLWIHRNLRAILLLECLSLSTLLYSWIEAKYLLTSLLWLSANPPVNMADMTSQRVQRTSLWLWTNVPSTLNVTSEKSGCREE